MSTTIKAADLADEHVGQHISWSEPDPYDNWTNRYAGTLVGVVKTWDPCGQAGCPCRSYVWVTFTNDSCEQTIGLRYGDEVNLA